MRINQERVDAVKQNAGPESQPTTSGEQTRPKDDTTRAATPRRDLTEDERDEQDIQRARDAARSRIVEAEKFKASVDLVPGMSNPFNDDDDFFLSTCHADKGIEELAAQSQFVDMNKIYPRQNDYKSSQDTRLEIINKDGHTYFVPAGDSTKRVYNFYTWQKSFRVYATFFVKHNPQRAAEILQYIDVIGNAASSFVWENVAAYDYVHRQLMHQKPKRTWSKIYQQGWSMSMKEHLSMRNSSQNKKGAGNRKSDVKDPYCWRYNKNNCKRTNCPYEHRCSYCGAAGHGAYSCRKKSSSEQQDAKQTSEEKQTGTGKKDK